MTTSILFSTYLHDVMTARKISDSHLAHELGYHREGMVRHWLRGHGRPSLALLPQLAETLRADPVDMACGWIIDQVPEFEKTLRQEVLDPRRSQFPRSTDLTLHAPRPFRF